jgi:hypothetical protein
MMKLCYFFFNNGDESRRDAKSALAAILHQLCKKNKGLLKQAFEIAKNLADKCHSYAGLWDVFEELVVSDGVQIICVLDALDECEEYSRLRFSGNLVNLLQNPKVGKRLKVVITSRPYGIINDGFDSGGLAPGQFQRVGHISEETQQIEKEILNFIYSKIQHFQRTRQRRIGVVDNVHLTLQKWVMGKINRNYLWVSFIFKELEKNAGLPMNDLKDVIETLPSTCSEAYEKILRQSTYPKKARTLLQAVLGATRPLRISELCFVLSMRDGEEKGEDFNCIQNSGFAKTIQELCGFFITVDEDKVYLMHQTAKEFLVQSSDTPTSFSDPLAWEHSLCIEAGHELLARTCIQYLQFDVFEERPLQVDDEFLFYDPMSDIHLWHQVDYCEAFARIETYLQRHQFLEYAARHWFEHYELSGATGDERWAPPAIKICDVQSKVGERGSQFTFPRPQDSFPVFHFEQRWNLCPGLGLPWESNSYFETTTSVMRNWRCPLA